MMWIGSFANCAFAIAILTIVAKAMKPMVISSEKMLRHRPAGYHPECPERITNCLQTLREMANADIIRLVHPSAESIPEREELALSVIRMTHTEEYVQEVKMRCEKGARMIDPWDQDTYISRHSFEQTIHAQSAWLDGVDEVVKNKNVRFDYMARYQCIARNCQTCLLHIIDGICSCSTTRLVILVCSLTVCTSSAMMVSSAMNRIESIE
jgi:hypothetical protein